MILTFCHGQSQEHLNSNMSFHNSKKMNIKAKTACQCLLAMCLLLISRHGVAQDSSHYRFTELFGQQYDFFSASTLVHPLLPVDEYAIISASYRQEQGKYIARQNSPAEEFITFKTKGTRQLRGFKVSGMFAYAHIGRDSVGYILGNYGVTSPYYFYSQAKGNWEVSKYDLNGMVSRSFADDRLSVSIGGAFNAGNAWRSNDPRMEEFMHNLEGSLALHYRLAAAHTLGIQGTFGSLALENSNEYRNKDYQSNLENLAYINYINYGYGLNTMQTTGRQINHFREGFSLGGVYQARLSSGSLTLTGETGSRNSRLLRKASEAASANYRYGDFEEQIHKADLMWMSRETASGRWAVKAHYLDHIGKDNNTILHGNNYVYYHNELAVKPVYAFVKNGRTHSEVSLTGGRERLYQADGNTDHVADYIRSHAGITGALYLPAGKTGLVKVLAEATKSWSDRAQLTVPASQENDFTRGVAYFDYYYQAAGVNSIKAEILYNLPVKNTDFFIKADYTLQQAKLPAVKHAATELPGSKREIFCLSLGFTL